MDIFPPVVQVIFTCILVFIYSIGFGAIAGNKTTSRAFAIFVVILMLIGTIVPILQMTALRANLGYKTLGEALMALSSLTLILIAIGGLMGYVLAKKEERQGGARLQRRDDSFPSGTS